jgi:uncharacterized membrane protein
MGAAASVILLGASSPPFLSAGARALVMHAFAPVCHQLPGRSPVLDGVQFAVCDRCLGIYAGVLLGILTLGWGRRLWARLRAVDRVVLLGSLVPIALDWAGPVLGLWPNVPLSRAGTGLLFGGVAASFAADRLLLGLERRG